MRLTMVLFPLLFIRGYCNEIEVNYIKWKNEFVFQDEEKELRHIHDNVEKMGKVNFLEKNLKQQHLVDGSLESATPCHLSTSSSRCSGKDWLILLQTVYHRWLYAL